MENNIILQRERDVDDAEDEDGRKVPGRTFLEAEFKTFLLIEEETEADMACLCGRCLF